MWTLPTSWGINEDQSSGVCLSVVNNVRYWWTHSKNPLIQLIHLLSGGGVREWGCWKELHVSQSAAKMVIIIPLLMCPNPERGGEREDEGSDEGNVLFLTEVKWTFGCDCSNTNTLYPVFPLPGCDPPAPHADPLQPQRVPPLTVKGHIRAFIQQLIQTVLASFVVPRMWNNRAWSLVP